MNKSLAQIGRKRNCECIQKLEAHYGNTIHFFRFLHQVLYIDLHMQSGIEYNTARKKGLYFLGGQ